jgi:hypothetical protein
MSAGTDKVIITNLSALMSKYGSAGVNKIRKAVDQLIASDKTRGLATALIAVEDATAMKKLSATPVTTPGDPKQNKVAIDGIYRALAPSYMVILGSKDVVPHQDLNNPMYSSDPDGDSDKNAFGDLPYACEAPYSQKPQDFFGPTRVVGRLPDLTGERDPAYLIKLLQTAAAYKSRPISAYATCLGISAQIWQKSTGLSLDQIFGNHSDLNSVPPKSSKWSKPLLGRLAHFINCHGADTSQQFYGQPASGAEDYPVSLDAAYINRKMAEGAVVAAECCYGGQLFPPSDLKGKQGICNTYLANKAYGFFASTTIAYGPSDSNAQADLICQYFLDSVFAGASLGRAALEARQKFVRTASPPDPSDIKTLSQFNLYGDPSVTPVETPSPAVPAVAGSKAKAPRGKMRIAPVSHRAERLDRRRSLFRVGTALANTEPQAHPTSEKPARSVQADLNQKARELGMDPATTLSFICRYQNASAVAAMPKSLRPPQLVPARFHVVFGKKKKHEEAAARRIPRVVALIGKEVEGAVVSVKKIVSR